MNLSVMNWWENLDWFVEVLYFSLLVEEAILVTLCYKEVELEVATRELHVAGYGRPLAEGDGLALGGAVGQRIAADDVFQQHVSEGEEIWLLSHLSEMPVALAVVHHHTALRLYGVNCTACVQPLRGWVLGKDILFQSCAAGFGIVGQDVDTVAGAHGDEALEFPFGLGFDVFQKGEFAAQDFDKEVAVATGGLKEAAVEPERLVAH